MAQKVNYYIFALRRCKAISQDIISIISISHLYNPAQDSSASLKVLYAESRLHSKIIEKTGESALKYLVKNISGRYNQP